MTSESLWKFGRRIACRLGWHSLVTSRDVFGTAFRQRCVNCGEEERP